MCFVFIQSLLIQNYLYCPDACAEETSLNQQNTDTILDTLDTLDKIIDENIRKKIEQKEEARKKKKKLLLKYKISLSGYISKEKMTVLSKKYLSKGELYAPLICETYFPKMSVEQINDSIREITRFIEYYVFVTAIINRKKIGVLFLTNILHTYGHIIRFIEDARVNLKTKKVFRVDDGEWVPNCVSLSDYWAFMEDASGYKLHCHKFYATCIDYLSVMLRSFLLFPAKDWEQVDDVELRWLHWIERIEKKLNGNKIFGGYYHENVKFFREVFLLWEDDFSKKQELERPTEEELSYSGGTYDK